eukprot:jgi/Mesvir1/21243/Mv06673-RA.1
MATAGTPLVDLLSLQGRCKRDPEGYKDEFMMQFRHYRACLSIFLLKPTSESKEFGDLVMFLAQVSACYADVLAELPQQIIDLLLANGEAMNPQLRKTLVQALILMRTRKMVTPATLFPLFFHLFRCPDKSLREHLFKFMVNDIKAANAKHRDEKMNKSLQNFLYTMVQDDNIVAAKKSLDVIIELYRRHVWTDARTVNIISSACFSKHTRTMVAALKFFLGQDQVTEEEEEEEEDSEGEEDPNAVPQVNRSDYYKANYKGTLRTKRKKQAKLKRVMQSMRKATKKESAAHEAGTFTALQLLQDPHTFAEKLFARLQSCNERFEVKMMIIYVISRVIGTHKVLLLNFYPYLMRYLQPHQKDVTQVLAAAVQACHDLVPPDALEPLMRQVVNHFVHDRARADVKTVGLKTVRELCARAPLVMTKELLEDLIQYRKEKEKGVSMAARSLLALYQEIAPSMLPKKERGRGADLAAAPKAYGVGTAVDYVPGIEFLDEARRKAAGEDDDDDDDDEEDDDEDGSGEEGSDGMELSGDEDDEDEDSDGESEGSDEEEEGGGKGGSKQGVKTKERTKRKRGAEGESDDEDGEEEGEGGERPAKARKAASGEKVGMGEVKSRKGKAAEPEDEDMEELSEGSGEDEDDEEGKPKAKKEDVPPEKMSLRELRKIQKAEAEEQEKKRAHEAMLRSMEGILSPEDFKALKALKTAKQMEAAMAKHGLKSAAKKGADKNPASARAALMNGSLWEKRVDPLDLQGVHRHKADKAERLASIMAGREGRDKFGSSTARKNKKTGGLSNRQQQNRKEMPLAARRSKAAKRSIQKKKFARVAPKLHKGKMR